MFLFYVRTAAATTNSPDPMYSKEPMETMPEQPEQTTQEKLIRAQNLLAQSAEFYEKHDLDGAEALLLEALALCEAAEGRRSLSVSTCLNNLGRIYENKAHFAKATRFHGEACVTRQALLGNHVETAFSLANYSAALMGDGQWGQAMEGLNMALVMYKKLNMLDSAEANACRQNMAVCKEASGCTG